MDEQRLGGAPKPMRNCGGLWLSIVQALESLHKNWVPTPQTQPKEGQAGQGPKLGANALNLRGLACRFQGQCQVSPYRPHTNKDHEAI